MMWVILLWLLSGTFTFWLVLTLMWRDIGRITVEDLGLSIFLCYAAGPVGILLAGFAWAHSKRDTVLFEKRDKHEDR